MKVTQKLFPWQILLKNSMKKSAKQQIKQQVTIIQQSHELHICRWDNQSDISIFSQNYSFLHQDDIHEFHWETDHATLQDYLFYYCISGPENGMKKDYVSFCVISDWLEHAVPTVHSFISCIICLVSDVLPYLQKVYYFSDGESSQYVCLWKGGP
jgi:hypothetical protein